MAKKILIALVVLVAILVVVILTRPDTFHFERSTEIAAPPAVVFAQVNDFHKWGAWSPWAKMDPTMKVEYSGPAAGKDAVYKWTGKDSGSGQMTILESRPPEHVRIKLDFTEPFAATNVTAFDIKPEGGKTKVTWMMEGTNTFVTKAFGLFMSIEDNVGKQYEQGLADIKKIAEAEAARVAAEAQAAQPAEPAAQPTEQAAQPAQ